MARAGASATCACRSRTRATSRAATARRTRKARARPCRGRPSPGSVGIFARLGVERVRLTGGEPTLRPDLLAIVRDIASVPGIHEIALTTNGQLLDRLAAPLRDAGVSRINVSLDTLRPDSSRAPLREDRLAASRPRRPRRGRSRRFRLAQAERGGGARPERGRAGRPGALRMAAGCHRPVHRAHAVRAGRTRGRRPR